MYIIVGLGNPGRRYAQTRHNIGFMVLDELAAKNSAYFSFSNRLMLWCPVKINDKDCLLVKPQTYMNLSGEAVGFLAKNISDFDLSELLVVSDDLNLPFGTLRLRPSGSDGGQKGIRSIINHLQTEKFARLRIGIGSPQGDVVDYVLSEFDGSEKQLLPHLLNRAANAIESFVTNGAQKTMSQFNGPLQINT
ncbi:MAG: aminoacyl-tRNA hydrolase [Calditrichia bacterium]